MKRRGAVGALAGWLAIGMIVCSGTMALGQEDIYENIGGLAFNGSVPPGGGGALFALQGGGSAQAGFSQSNATYNPNGIGQYLVGQYYDVRAVDGDAQVTNIAILNTNSNNPNLPSCTLVDVLQGRDGENCFFDQGNDSLPKGGILAKVRFRESRYSFEVLDFNIALSCGEVWTGRLELGGDGLPRLTSESLIVTGTSGTYGGGTLRTKPAFNPAEGGTPASFRFPSAASGRGLVPADAARGYMEVIGIADLPCEPVDSEGDPTSIDLENGNLWNLDSTFMATNALAAEAFLVRSASGVSFGYPFDAISRFRPMFTADPDGSGGALLPYVPGSPSVANIGSIFGNETPNIDNCLVIDLGGNQFAGQDCVRQFNLAYHKARLVGQYDISPITAGKTNFVVTLPTKYRNCGFGPGGGYIGVLPGTPFQCGPAEEVVCTLYDRLENLAEGGFTSPSETERCFLPRELTILGLPGSINADDILSLADTFETPAGWLAIQLDENAQGQPVHEEVFAPGTTKFDILGGRVQGYRGLPSLGMRLQEYENGNVGGTYGALLKMQADDPILFIGQS